MSIQRLVWLFVLSVSPEQVLGNSPPVRADSVVPPFGSAKRQYAKAEHARALEDRQVLLSGVKSPLLVQLSASIQWTPRLFRAGRIRIRPEGFVCGSVGSSEMHVAVQPSCVGNICKGPMPYDTGIAFWNGVRIARPGIYTLCWCEPDVSCAGPEAGFNGVGCCFTDSDFSVNKGEVLVQGPRWSSKEHPLLGEPFKVDLTGSVVTRSSRLLFRFKETEDADGNIVAGGRCGGSLSAEERDASEVLVREDRWSQNAPNSANFTVRLFRRRLYTACWCAGESHPETSLQDCAADDAFLAELRSMLPIGPQTESVSKSYAVVGVPFALKLNGNELGSGDRLRIIDGAKSCGKSDTHHSLAVSYFVCRGEANCVQSAVSMRPSIVLGTAPDQSEIWDPVVLTSPGLFRMCWCVDNSWDSQTLESNGLCSLNVQFAIPVGTLILEGIDDQQSFHCYAFTPCTIFVSSHLAVSDKDGIFIVSQQDLDLVTCGSGMQGVSLLATSVNRSYDSQGNRNNTITFKLSPHAGPPGTFRVCYCQSVGMGDCDEPTVFAQSAGKIHITSPPDGYQIALQEPPQYCLAGRSCSIGITGVWASQLHVSDAFRAVPVRFECGSAPLSVTSGIFSLAFRRAMSGGGMQASFLHADSWSKDPGDYRLCYCSVMMLQYGHTCDHHEYFQQNTGLLIMLGVKGVFVFRCSQGLACNITVPGWRFARDDRLLLLEGESAICGAAAADDVLALGFVTNPAGIPDITSAGHGDYAEFAFGLAYGAGTSRVCFCAANTSTSNCQDIGEFTQDVGTLKVSGAITSVSLSPAYPALSSIVSLIINAEFLSRVTCAITEHAMTTIPSYWDVTDCQERVESCLGVARLQWQIRPGVNIIHVPITFNRSLSSDTHGLQVHAWCAADDCPEGRCAMPPTPIGHVIDLQLGIISFSEWRVLLGEPLTFTITANPLNTKGALGVFNSSDGCGADTTLLDFGRPTETMQLSSVTWEDVVVAMPGRYLLCWCDRGYSRDCSLWHRAGIIVVAGPVVTGQQWLSWVNPSQAFNVSVAGVDLTDGGLMATVSGNNCSDIGPRLVNITAPFSASGDIAIWQLIAPAMEGNFTLCWGESSGSSKQRRLETNMSMFKTMIGSFQTIERKDCVLTSWVAGECDRPCGGGSFTERRGVIAVSTGGGEECPPGSGLVRTKSCNTQTCPTAVVLTARTIPATIQPGQIFKIVLEGEYLAPYEDSVILIRSDEECGKTAQTQGGATCDLPGSTTTKLECGDGVYSVRVERPGSYRICVCDASVSAVWRNGTEVRCGSTSTFSITPSNGSYFKTIGTIVPRNTDSLFNAAEEGSKSSSVRQQGDAPEDKSQDFVLILSLAGGSLVCLVALCSWRCLIKDYFVKAEVTKPVKRMDTHDLVEQATREVWNAYARSIVEGVEDEELRAASQAILDDNARAAALKIGSDGECISQPEPEPSDPNSSSSGSASTSRLTTPEDLVSRRSTTPPRGATPPGRKGTPPLTRNTTPLTPKSCRTPTGGSRRSRTPTGGSRACTPPTPKNLPSFFDESLPPLGAPKTPPQQGGSFLDMPLLGVSSQPPSHATGQDCQSDQNNESFKQSGSSWHSSLYRTRSSSLSSSSYTSSEDTSTADAPMAPRGKPSPFVNLQPLELPPRPSLEPALIEPGTPPSQRNSSEVLALETAPNPASPLGNSNLSSSTARPPGLELPKPPPSIPHAPEGPPLPPPEGLLDIMTLKTQSLMAQLPSMPPPPPPISTGKVGSGQEAPPPLLINAPAAPPALPPPLLSMSTVGDAFVEQAAPIESSTLLHSCPPKEIAAAQGASNGWRITSMFSGLRLPWSGSRKQSRSAKVSAMPASVPTPQPIGTLMQGEDHKANENHSSPTVEAIGARMHEMSESKADCPTLQNVPHLAANSDGSDQVRDSGIAAANRLPTQKPEMHSVPTESGASLRETASAEMDSSKQKTPTDARSEARSFMATLPGKRTGGIAPTLQDADANSQAAIEKIPLPCVENEEASSVVQHTLVSSACPSNASLALSDGTQVSVQHPKVDTNGQDAPYATEQTLEPSSCHSTDPNTDASKSMIREASAPLAVISETCSSAEVMDANRSQSSPCDSLGTEALSSKDAMMPNQSQQQGRYIPGANSNIPSSAGSSRQRKRPKPLEDEDDVGSCAGSEYQLRWTGREESSPNAEGVRAEVAAAQEKIRKEWHDKLAAETDWNKVPHPKATLGRPHASTRDKLRPINASSGRLSRSSAASSQASSAVSSPQSQSTRGMPGPSLPGGFAPGPPLQAMPPPGSSQLASGSAMPGPPLAPKGRGPTLGPGPPLTAGSNSRGPSRALPAWALK